MQAQMRAGCHVVKTALIMLVAECVFRHEWRMNAESWRVVVGGTRYMRQARSA